MGGIAGRPASSDGFVDAEPSTLRSAVEQQVRVIYALILRDMRTRFGRSHFGYLVQIAWPIVHLSILIGIPHLLARVPPIGTDLTIYLVTAFLPYVLLFYPARLMCTAILTTKPLLLFPVVKSSDILIARAILEALTSYTVTIITITGMALVGKDVMPFDLVEAVFAIISIIFVGIGYGSLNAVISAMIPSWNIVAVLLLIIMYSTAMPWVLPTFLTPDLQYWLSWNPLFQAADWLKTAYYAGYDSGLLDRGYLIANGALCLAAAFLIERGIRGRLLQ